MKRTIVIVSAAIFAVLILGLIWARFYLRTHIPPMLVFHPATKVCQVTGGEDREPPGKSTGTQLTRVTGGITGTDLGFPFEFNNKLYFLFGDSREFSPDLCEPQLCGSEDNPIVALQPHQEQVQRWRSEAEWEDFKKLRGDGRDSMATAPLQVDPDQCIPVSFETTEVGLVFAHNITHDTISDPLHLDGKNVVAHPQDKWVLVMDNRLLVVTNDGSVFTHDINGNTIDVPFQLGSPRVAANPQDKWVLVMGKRILVITNDGGVFAHTVADKDVSGHVQLNGPKVAANPQDKWVLVMDNRILVITKDGNVFAHKVTDKDVSGHVQLTGSKVASNPQDKWVLVMGNRILVVTTDGRVFVHPVTDTTIGPAFRLGGPRVAANPRDRLVLAMRDRILVLTEQDGTFRPTQLNSKVLARKEGGIGAFIDGESVYAFFTLRDNKAPGCTERVFGCAHDDEQPGGQTVLAKSVADDGKFEQKMVVSKTKFLWAVPEVVKEARNIPGLQTTGKVVLVWGAGRENNDKGVNVAKWNHSYPFLAVAPLPGVEQKENWRYFAGLKANGQPDWQHDEARAEPLPGFKSETLGKGYHECLGYFSVRFIEGWGTWVMSYTCSNDASVGYNANNGARGVYVRTASAPWGPWSEPQLVFNPGVNGYCYFMHNQDADENCECKDKGSNPSEESVRDAPPSLEPGTPTKRGWGGEYAPLLLPSRYAKVGTNEATLYFLMSTWNPYQVVLMKTQVTGRP